MKKLIAAIVVVAVGGLLILRKGRVENVPARVNELHFYVWANYIDPEVYKIFEQQTGIRVVEEIMDSNEALENKLKAGVTGYDVIVPSDYAVQKLARQNLLATLDHGNIPNLAGLSPRFKSPYYDVELRTSVPYMWGTSGIGFSKSRVSPPPTSWGDLFDITKVTAHKGKISFLDDPREVIGAALKYKGYSVNSTDEAQLAEARSVLLGLKPYVGRFDNENVGNFLITGDISLALAWSGTVVKFKKQSADLGYIIPKEGCVIWADNLSIPANIKDGERKKAAEMFINFLLDPEINGRIVNYIYYPSALESAKPHINKDILEDPAMYPSEDVLAKLEWMQDLGEAGDQYERIWAEFKAE